MKYLVKFGSGRTSDRKYDSQKNFTLIAPPAFSLEILYINASNYTFSDMWFLLHCLYYF